MIDLILQTSSYFKGTLSVYIFLNKYQSFELYIVISNLSIR